MDGILGVMSVKKTLKYERNNNIKINKFRGYATNDAVDRYVFGSFVFLKRTIGSRHHNVSGQSLIIDENNIAYDVYGDSVGQYSGEKDIEGTEIYEGDLFLIEDNETNEPRLAECVWDYEKVGFELYEPIVGDPLFIHIYELSKLLRTLVVAGNRYMNEELLEGFEFSED